MINNILGHKDLKDMHIFDIIKRNLINIITKYDKPCIEIMSTYKISGLQKHQSIIQNLEDSKILISSILNSTAEVFNIDEDEELDLQWEAYTNSGGDEPYASIDVDKILNSIQ